MGRSSNGLSGCMTLVKNSKNIFGASVKDFHELSNFFFVVTGFSILHADEVVCNIRKLHSMPFLLLKTVIYVLL